MEIYNKLNNDLQERIDCIIYNTNARTHHNELLQDKIDFSVWQQ